MAEQRVQRRLAAILAADVVGYSRLMEADEEGTRARLRRLHADLINPQIAADGGRVVKTTGDGVLVEFPSAVDAVRNALAIQQSMAERNATFPEDRRMAFRVGVNLGDVMVEDEDIHGDGVNVAVRLEGLCEPGAVYVSGSVHDQVAGKLEARFDDLGERSVKNLSRAVRVYRASPGTTPAGRRAASPVPAKPSIAVLPFVNLSADPDQEYFADGMVDEIITGLSRLGWLYVAARTSSFAFKGQNLDIREIARRLDVRYVLEGSVRKAGQRVRIIGQLIDAGTGAHVWADRFEGHLDDVFDLQDRITESVVTAIQPSVLSAEIERAKRKRPESLDAYDLYLRALPLAYASSHDSAAEGRRLLDEALAMDPGFAPSSALASWFYMYAVIAGAMDTVDEYAARGASLAINAINADAEDPMVLSHAPFVLATLGKDLDAACAVAERGVRLYPKNTMILSQSGYILTFVGDQEKALARCETAFRLNPDEPLAFRFLTGAAIACMLMGRYADAVAYAEESRQRNRRFGVTYRMLAAAYAQLGESEKAAEALARYRELDPGSTISHLKRQLPYRDPEQSERLYAGLRKAGLPE